MGRLHLYPQPAMQDRPCNLRSGQQSHCLAHQRTSSRTNSSASTCSICNSTSGSRACQKCSRCAWTARQGAMLQGHTGRVSKLCCKAYSNQPYQRTLSSVQQQCMAVYGIRGCLSLVAASCTVLLHEGLSCSSQPALGACTPVVLQAQDLQQLCADCLHAVTVVVLAHVCTVSVGCTAIPVLQGYRSCAVTHLCMRAVAMLAHVCADAR